MKLEKKELLVSLAKECLSVSEVLRKLGLTVNGGNHSNIKKQFEFFQIDISHFVGRKVNLHRSSGQKKGPAEILRNTGKLQHGYRLKRALLESGVKEECSKCGIGPIWQGKKLSLQVDHIDGTNTNHEPSNLRIICPNCHSQTETYAGKKQKFVKDMQLAALDMIINDVS